jgi:hypothetical protein
MIVKGSCRKHDEKDETMMYVVSGLMPVLRCSLKHGPVLCYRTKVFEDIDRMIHPETIYDNVVYSLDDVVTASGPDYLNRDTCNLNNRDELRVGRQEVDFGQLRFNAQFESGNLRKVVQVCMLQE